MITMKGKYNSANIFIDNIDDATREQIQGFLNHPAFGKSYIAIMPDCHAGKGSVIGFTMKMNDYIIPNIVGNDVGCGIFSANFGKIDIDLAELDKFVHDKIRINCRDKAIDHIDDLLDTSKIFNLTSKVGFDFDRALKQIGTPGQGNHFIELGKDSNGNVWVTIHTGSRGLGAAVAKYHQDVAKANLAKYFIPKDQYRDAEFLIKDSDEGQDYLKDMRFCQNYASMNRRVIMTIMAEFLGRSSENHECVHNFIAEDNIIRKGATSAREGEFIIVPFNMRDGIMIGRGKGSKKYNFSSPHGAGRILSRTKAKAQIDMEAYRKSMAGVYSSTVTESTIDEAPMAYKDKDLIIKNVEETMDVIDFLKPIYNFKGV